MKILLFCTLCTLFFDASFAHSSEFKKTTAKIGSKKIMIEIAKTDFERSRGLMFRKSLGKDEGMLFVFPKAEPQSFWMKNTLIPLSIGYFDSAMVLTEVLEMVPADPKEKYPRSYPSARPSQYALEMNKNWFVENKIPIGSKLSVDWPNE